MLGENIASDVNMCGKSPTFTFKSTAFKFIPANSFLLTSVTCVWIHSCSDGIWLGRSEREKSSHCQESSRSCKGMVKRKNTIQMICSWCSGPGVTASTQSQTMFSLASKHAHNLSLSSAAVNPPLSLTLITYSQRKKTKNKTHSTAREGHYFTSDWQDIHWLILFLTGGPWHGLSTVLDSDHGHILKTFTWLGKGKESCDTDPRALQWHRADWGSCRQPWWLSIQNAFFFFFILSNCKTQIIPSPLT